MAQNTTHAVMSQRTEAKDSLDDFPTPPWATRALVEHIIGVEDVQNLTVLEPACGRGYMSETLGEYFREVTSSDIFSYGYGEEKDFLFYQDKNLAFDWVITNPPFKLAEEFVKHGLRLAKVGVAVLVRTVFIESVGRYERLFRDNPCSKFAQFVERVPIVKGRVDPKASTATGYAWLIWQKKPTSHSLVTWIPPSRKRLERPGDHILPELRAELLRKWAVQPDFFSIVAE